MHYPAPPISEDGRLACRFCNYLIEPRDLSFVAAYWVGKGSRIRSFEHPEQTITVAIQPKYPCHKGCKREGSRIEAVECQKLDQACNDCKHYQRQGRPQPPTPLPTDRRLTEKEQISYLRKSMWSGGDSFGLCDKRGTMVSANPQVCELNTCFEHRRT